LPLKTSVPEAEEQPQYRAKPLGQEKSKCCPVGLTSTKGYPSLSSFNPNRLFSASRKNNFCLFNPTSFCCDAKDSEKKRLVSQKSKVFRLLTILYIKKYPEDKSL